MFTGSDKVKTTKCLYNFIRCGRNNLRENSIFNYFSSILIIKEKSLTISGIHTTISIKLINEFNKCLMIIY